MRNASFRKFQFFNISREACAPTPRNSRDAWTFPRTCHVFLSWIGYRQFPVSGVWIEEMGRWRERSGKKGRDQGCLPFTQTTRVEILCINITLDFPFWVFFSQETIFLLQKIFYITMVWWQNDTVHSIKTQKLSILHIFCWKPCMGCSTWAKTENHVLI